MGNFTINLANRVNNTVLPESKCLWPLFEAVVNSIQSIEDSVNSDNGKIEILATRIESNQIDIHGKLEVTPFESFSITDNGLGFNKANYKSFKTADSTLKLSKGCKGIGRFLWLVAFDHIQIDSNYHDDGAWCSRSFSFTTDGTEPDDEVTASSLQDQITTITLSGFKRKYQSLCPVGLDILARQIVEHCMIFFLSEGCPHIILKDNLGEMVDLNSYFTTEIKASLHQDSINMGDESFTLYHLRMPEGVNRHEFHLCANRREVTSMDLSKHIRNLQKRIVSAEDKKGFYYLGYLMGPFLDSHVNPARTAFDFPVDDDTMSLIPNDISQKGLIEASKAFIETYLSDYLKLIAERKRETITNYVYKQKPQYRYLISHKPDIFDDIPADLSDEKLEIELHSAMLQWEYETKEEGERLQREISRGAVDESIQESFEKYRKAINDISKTSLAEYVIRRKAIIDLLEKALQLDEQGNYSSEASVHSIICPMRYTSDDVDLEEMNLWIIDERLSYHNYLASDKTMHSIPVIDANNTKEMDIAVFNQAMSFGENSTPLNSVTIIEFKKPNRNDMKPDDKNPIHQVLGYVADIKAGRKMKANGRPFGDVNNAAFYCYVIADLTSSMIEDALNAGLRYTPDRQGFFGYNDGRGAYIEVISYEKLLNDAKQRNRILFDKLFTPKLKEVFDKGTDKVGTTV